MQSRNLPFTRRWPFAAGRTDLRLLRQQQQPSVEPSELTEAGGEAPALATGPRSNPGRWLLSGVAVMLALTAVGYALSRRAQV